MIRMILQRELLHHFMSLRFSVLIAMSMILFTINGFQFVDQYQKELSSYSSDTIEQWNKRGTTGTKVFQKPNPLSFCVEGGERTQPRAIELWLGVKNPLPRTQYENYKLPYVNAIDWVFILKIIFGLFGIILCFDSICGERVFINPS